MAGSTIPPQAYTAETLARAYEWLKSQPKPIQELAKNADVLVGLYLKARRSGHAASALHRASNEAFRSDLKNLAEDMKQFEPEKTASPPTPPASETDTLPKTEPPPSYEPQRASEPRVTQEQPSPTRSPRAQTLGSRTEPQSSDLDPRSAQIVQEVQQAFNLSHPNEAMRMLIVMGFEKLRDILPR